MSMWAIATIYLATGGMVVALLDQSTPKLREKYRTGKGATLSMPMRYLSIAIFIAFWPIAVVMFVLGMLQGIYLAIVYLLSLREKR